MNGNPSATPRALRTVISIVGCRNAGKSSLINALAGQDVAIVSDRPGTTTDAVAKPYELLPLGPVTFFDTAGLDDTGELGALRVKAAKKVLYRSDVAVIAVSENGLGQFEKEIIVEVQRLKIPFVVAFNKSDIKAPTEADIEFCRDTGIPFAEVSARTKKGIDELKNLIIDAVPEDIKREPLLAGDLFNPGDVVLLVVPIDLSAPKGRLILPQVQVLREVLDRGAKAVAVEESELTEMLAELKRKPALVITDSQVVTKVADEVPEDVPMTTFSILFARNKGDIAEMYRGAEMIDRLRDGDRVLIAEACSHHVLSDDIGKVKIPNWLRKYTDKELTFEFCQGSDFPEDLEKYALVIHCGACMLNRREMVHRIKECAGRGVPITNYGLAISKTQGVLERAIRPLGLSL